MKEKRFKKVYSQGKITSIQIWVDTETGVNYMYMEGSTGGLTPLLDANGKVIIAKDIE